MSRTTRDVAQAIVSVFTGGDGTDVGHFELAGRTYTLLPLVGGKVPPAPKRAMRRLADESLDRQITTVERMVTMILDSVPPSDRARLRTDLGRADLSEAQHLAERILGLYAAAVRAAGGTPEDAL